MTRLDFELLAKALKETKPPQDHVEEYGQWCWMVEHIVTRIREFNPAFKPQQFRDACGV